MATADPRPLLARPLLTRRLRPADLLVLDALVAILLVLLCAYAATEAPAPGGSPIQPLLGAGLREPGWVGVLVAIVIAAPLAVRRRWPLPVFLISLGASAAALLIGIIPVYASGAPFTPVAFALYLVAVVEPFRRALSALLLGLAVAVLTATALSASVTEAAYATAFLSTFGATLWTIGRAVRQRRDYGVRSAAHQAQQAVSDERVRIARELHDIVAHSMSLIAVQAAVANHVAEDRPAEARAALRVIEATSRDALVEMRRTLQVLRGGQPAPLSPLPAPPVRPPAVAAAPPGPSEPGLADLPKLVARATSAGALRAELSVPDDTAAVPEDVGRSAYRIVQEALTNAVQHAGRTHCRITVGVEAHVLRLEIIDDGPPAGAAPSPPSGRLSGHGPEHPVGHGLLGMRERAVLHRGELSAGPRPEGGFAVAARLPFTPDNLR